MGAVQYSEFLLYMNENFDPILQLDRNSLRMLWHCGKADATRIFK